MNLQIPRDICKSDLLIQIPSTGRLEMTEKKEVMRRIGKIDEILVILYDLRRSEMTELEEIERLEETGQA